MEVERLDGVGFPDGLLSVLGRGRTSSRKLRLVLRSTFARALSAGVFFAIGFVQSGLNVADIPSRTA